MAQRYGLHGVVRTAAFVCLVHATMLLVPVAQAEMLDRSHSVELAEDATIESFYRAQPAGGDGDAFQYVGLLAHSRQSESDLSAWLELSAVAAPHQGPEHDRHVVRLGLQDRVKDVDLMLRYFSVGEAVIGNPLAMNRIQSLGLPLGAEGAQFRAGWNALGMKIVPQAGWQSRDTGGQLQNEESVALAL